MDDIQETRRKVLAAIVERDGLASASRRFGKPDRQINDMIAGRKSFGEKVARAMETAYDPSKPPGWLDGKSSAAAKVKAMPQRYPSEIESVIKLMLETDDVGRGIALGAVTIALQSHRPTRKQKAS